MWHALLRTFTHLLDRAVLVLLLKYEVLQLQVDIPAWHLRGCLLLTAAGRLSACAGCCVPCTPCWNAEAITVAFPCLSGAQENCNVLKYLLCIGLGYQTAVCGTLQAECSR